MKNCCKHNQLEAEDTPAHAEEGDFVEQGRCDIIFDDDLQPVHHMMQGEDDHQTNERGVDGILHPKQKLVVLCRACDGKGEQQQPRVEGEQGYGADALSEPVFFSCMVSVRQDEEPCKA